VLLSAQWEHFYRTYLWCSRCILHRVYYKKLKLTILLAFLYTVYVVP
jgi:hypothetical protein